MPAFSESTLPIAESGGAAPLPAAAMKAERVAMKLAWPTLPSVTEGARHARSAPAPIGCGCGGGGATRTPSTYCDGPPPTYRCTGSPSGGAGAGRSWRFHSANCSNEGPGAGPGGGGGVRSYDAKSAARTASAPRIGRGCVAASARASGSLDPTSAMPPSADRTNFFRSWRTPSAVGTAASMPPRAAGLGGGGRSSETAGRAVGRFLTGLSEGSCIWRTTVSSRLARRRRQLVHSRQQQTQQQSANVATTTQNSGVGSRWYGVKIGVNEHARLSPPQTPHSSSSAGTIRVVLSASSSTTSVITPSQPTQLQPNDAFDAPERHTPQPSMAASLHARPSQPAHVSLRPPHTPHASTVALSPLGTRQPAPGTRKCGASGGCGGGCGARGASGGCGGAGGGGGTPGGKGKAGGGGVGGRGGGGGDGGGSGFGGGKRRTGSSASAMMMGPHCAAKRPAASVSMSPVRAASMRALSPGIPAKSVSSSCDCPPPPSPVSPRQSPSESRRWCAARPTATAVSSRRPTPKSDTAAACSESAKLLLEPMSSRVALAASKSASRSCSSATESKTKPPEGHENEKPTS